MTFPVLIRYLSRFPDTAFKKVETKAIIRMIPATRSPPIRMPFPAVPSVTAGASAPSSAIFRKPGLNLKSKRPAETRIIPTICKIPGVSLSQKIPMKKAKSILERSRTPYRLTGIFLIAWKLQRKATKMIKDLNAIRSISFVGTPHAVGISGVVKRKAIRV